MPATQWIIPRTHYDFISAREPELLDSINTDIEHIRSTGLQGPFGSTDDLPSAFGGYLDWKIDAVRTSLREQAEAVFGPLDDDEFEATFKQMPELPNLIYGAGYDYLSCLNFSLFNKKTFYITDNLVSNLAVTELDAPSEYVRLPFPSCMFVIDSDIAVNALYQIAQQDPPPSAAPITVFLTELPYGEYRKIVIVAYHSNRTQVFNLVKRELLIRPDWSIERALHTNWDNLYEENREWLEPDAETVGEVYGFDVDERIFYEDGLSFFRIIINAILYLASSKPDIISYLSPAAELQKGVDAAQSRAKRKKIKNELAKASILDGAVVGSSVGYIFVDRSLTASTSSVPGDGKMHKRFLVRGHWRNQACGEGRADRKLIFIEPYLKGPELAELVNRTYVVR